MAGLVTCQVSINGTPFNDGCTNPDDSAPTILSGLRITWGRNSTVDQPEPATCAFTVLDPTPYADSLSLIKVGVPITVNGQGTISAPPEGGSFIDPGLSSLAAVETVGGSSKATSNAPGVQVAKTSTGTWHSTFLPAPRDTTWLGQVPQSSPGQVWQVTATFTLPYAATVYLVPCWFSGPADQAPITSAAVASAKGPAWGAVTLSGDVTAPGDAGGYYLGLRLRVVNSDTWASLDPGVTWDSLTATGGAAPNPWSDAFSAAFGGALISEAPMWGALNVSNVDALPPGAGTAIQPRIFTGYVTDVDAGYALGAGGLQIRVTAADFSADLSNRVIGDAVWNEQTALARAQAIMAAASNPASLTMDAVPGSFLVARRDVDAQSPLTLLHELATGVDAVVWPRYSEALGDNFWLEDMGGRASTRTLEKPGATVVITPTDAPQIANALDIGGCDVLLEPVTWRQDSTDVITRVGLRWIEQGTDTEGNPTQTEHTAWVYDYDAEAAFGVRTLSVGSELTTNGDATLMATRISSRAFGLAWRIDGLVFDAISLDNPQPSDVDLVGQLLDMTARIGRALVIDQVPTWAPGVEGGTHTAFLEGGNYEYVEGHWRLALVTSDAFGSGLSATWADLLPFTPAWHWQDFDPTITFSAMRGASV